MVSVCFGLNWAGKVLIYFAHVPCSSTVLHAIESQCLWLFSAIFHFTGYVLGDLTFRKANTLINY